MRPPPSLFLLVACLALAGAAAAPAVAAVPEGWFIWPMVEPAAGSALDASELNRTAGGKLSRISVRNGKFVTADGQPIRFWGCNLSALEAFPPTAEEARALARRLAKAGVNIARLHHLDNPWAVESGGSLWPRGSTEHRALDAEQLDKLHRLIAALRDEGIYSNLNLKVSKSLTAADGFADSVTQLPSFQKRVDIYDRRMIELQKDYARRLLTTTNPYTGLAPAADPAVAIVETNNENSLLGYWTRDLGRGLDKLPEPFRRDLQAQWNAWLSRRYPNDDALAVAWAPAPGGGLSLIAPDAIWHRNVNDRAAAVVTPGADATEFEIRVTETTGIAHHVQLSTFGVPIADGAVYTVEFQAKADAARSMGVGASADNSADPSQPWRSLGLLETVDLGRDWRRIRLSFAAHSAGKSAGQLSFSAGHATGRIWIKDLILIRDAPGAGLQPGQSIAAATVPIPTTPSARQWSDWITFLTDTERAYAEEMRAYLKNDLHVQAPVTCTQIDYGGISGLHREQSMDFADAHAYWQHPDFIGRDWDPTHWVIRNSPQVAVLGDRSFGEFGNLALVRVAGKPYTLSEYDHAAPTDFACEMYPTLASFAARQEWDIVYPFAVAAYGAANPDRRIRDFFDQMNHPAKWSQSIFAARVFRRALVPPAPAAVVLQLGSPVWAEQPHADVLWRDRIEGTLDFLNVRYAVSDRPGEAGAKARVIRSGTSEAAAPVRVITAPQGNVWLVAAERAAAAVGFLGGTTVEVGPLRVACARFGRDFASVTAVALDGRPLPDSSRVLITVVARAANQDMVWNEARTSVGANWGNGPTIAERVPATLTLAAASPRKVYALSPDGARASQVATEQREGAVAFPITPEHRTLHYEVVLE